MTISINGINQSVPSSEDYGRAVQDITILKTVGPSERADQQHVYVEDQLRPYYFDLQSVSAESLPDIVEPGDSPAAGRWIRLPGAGGAPAPHAASHTDGSDQIAAVTGAVNGLMIAADKTKLDGIGALANVTSVFGRTGVVIATVGDYQHSDIIGLGSDDHHAELHAADHVTGGAQKIRDATAAVDGLATAAQISKLDGIAALADVTGANAPQAHALSHKGGGGDEIAFVTGALNGLMTAGDKTKLDGIIAGAQVQSVFGRTGAVGAQANDYTHAQLSAIGVDDHHAQSHRASHIAGGGDAFLTTDFIDGIIARIRTTTGPTDMLVGAVADGEFLKRVGGTIVGGTAGGGGDMLADGTVPWTGTQVPTTTNIEGIGTTTKTFKEILVNIVQPGTGRDLDLNSEDGSVSLSISNNALTISHRIQPAGTNLTAIGTTALALKEFIGNILRPGTAKDLDLKNAGGTTIIQLPNGGGLTFAASLDFGADNTHDVGDATAAARVVYGNVLQPGSTGLPSLLIKDAAANTVITVSNAGDLILDPVGGIQVKSAVTPDVTNTLDFGTPGFVFRTMHANEVHPGTGVSLTISSGDGTSAIVVTDTEITIHDDIELGSDNALDIGKGGGALRRVFSNNIRPSGNPLKLEAANGGQRIAVDNTGIHFFTGATVAQAAALTAADASVIDATYGATEEAVLNNVRTRLNEVDTLLDNYGLIA